LVEHYLEYLACKNFTVVTSTPKETIGRLV